MNTKRHLQFLVIVTLILMTLSPISATALSPVLHVVQGGQTSGACDSWANACDLQYALTSAVSGQEIWVAAGVYKPGTSRTDTFQLKSGVGLYGGFIGTETTRDERDWETNKTVLSGDIDNNDINVDGNFIAETTADIQGKNSNHVLFAIRTDSTAVLDGFVITAGQQANDGLIYHGGGINIMWSSPKLANLIFSANSSSWGGGMANYNGSPTLTNVAFSANTALYFGGGMENTFGDPTLVNVIFSHNTAIWCGGIYNENEGYLTLMNSSFFSNSALRGGGLCNEWRSNITILNSILWNNSAPNAPEIFDPDGSVSVTYSDVQGGRSGMGNIDADPMFVNAVNGELHLQAGSPAIDSGTNDGCPATDFDGVIRPQDGNNDGTATCDMGAFEFLNTTIPIQIDIKPGSYPNPINLGSKGVTPVAVLTTDEFDVSDLDPATVVFAGAFPLRWAWQDVDWDGDMDLLFHLNTPALMLDQTSTEAVLTGKTFDGISVEGRDVVKIVPK